MKLFAIIIIGFATCAFAQDRAAYIENAAPIAEFPMHFNDGYMFVTVPVIDSDNYGKAIVLQRDFILDPAASNDGSYLPDDSIILALGAKKFYFPVSKQRT